MDILLKNVEIIDDQSSFNRQKTNVHLKHGIIEGIGSDLEPGVQTVVDASNMTLTIGWFDMRANFCDPGYEYREDLDSGSSAASAGGFTEVALLPNTHPVVQTKNDISYIKSKGHSLLTQLHPIAAVTVDNKGTDLTEMIDLYEAGAVAFSDGDLPLWHTDICLKTLQYLQKFDGLLIDTPYDKLLSAFGTMNESIHSNMLGLKGMPALSEELAIIRDINLLSYTGGKIHISNISSARSVDLIREAKANGLDISCDIAAHQLAFDDSAFYNFDTNYKVNPPFRSREDVDALIKGLNDDTIEIIVSSHSPQDEESKKMEFDTAAFGIIGLQTVLPQLMRLSNHVDIEKLIRKITVAPRQRLGLEVPRIAEGAKANLTLFAPEKRWIFDRTTNKSKSNNSPFFGAELKGKVMGIFNQGKYMLEESLTSVS